jgi:type III secretion protein Q
LPLETVRPDHAEAFGRFYRRRQPLQIQISGRSATIQAAWPPADAIANAEFHSVRLSIDWREGLLVVFAALTEALLSDINASLSIAALTPADAALVLELAIEDALGRIETMSGCRIELLSLAPGAMVPGVPLVALTISLDVQGMGVSDGLLALPPGDAVALAGLLDAAAGADGGTIEDLPMPISVRVAVASPTVGDLACLRRGDILLVDEGCDGSASAVAVIAEHLVAPVELTAPGIRLSSRPVSGRGSAWEWSMERPTDSAGSPGLYDAELDDLPVRVLFEIGRIELSLSELRRLDVGAMLTLARGVDGAVEIVASGKRIGRGTVIKIGESLGVRVTRLFDHG